MSTNFDHCNRDHDSPKDKSSAEGEDTILSAVNQNTELLQQLFERLHRVGLADDLGNSNDSVDGFGVGVVNDDAIEAVDENVQLREANDQLLRQIDQLEDDVETLTQKNHDLASKVVYEGRPNPSPQSATPPVDTRSLSWEERKLQIIEQMENDSFDAETFLSTLRIEGDDERDEVGIQDAIHYVNDLNVELDRLCELDRLSQQSTIRYENEARSLKETIRQLEESVATQSVESLSADREFANDESAPTADRANASAEADVVDSVAVILDRDELIREERERLSQLQDQCEQNLRQIEIETSLERAKHSRERSEQSQQNDKLQEQIKALQRQAEVKRDGVVGTRWMAKLGLTGDSKE